MPLPPVPTEAEKHLSQYSLSTKQKTGKTPRKLPPEPKEPPNSSKQPLRKSKPADLKKSSRAAALKKSRPSRRQRDIYIPESESDTDDDANKRLETIASPEPQKKHPYINVREDGVDYFVDVMGEHLYDVALLPEEKQKLINSAPDSNNIRYQNASVIEEVRSCESPESNHDPTSPPFSSDTFKAGDTASLGRMLLKKNAIPSPLFKSKGNPTPQDKGSMKVLPAPPPKVSPVPPPKASPLPPPKVSPVPPPKASPVPPPKASPVPPPKASPVPPPKASPVPPPKALPVPPPKALPVPPPKALPAPPPKASPAPPPKGPPLPPPKGSPLPPPKGPPLPPHKGSPLPPHKGSPLPPPKGLPLSPPQGPPLPPPKGSLVLPPKTGEPPKWIPAPPKESPQRVSYGIASCMPHPIDVLKYHPLTTFQQLFYN